MCGHLIRPDSPPRCLTAPRPRPSRSWPPGRAGPIAPRRRLPPPGDLHHGWLSGRCPPGDPWARRRIGRLQAGRHHRHDHERAVAGGGDCRGGCQRGCLRIDAPVSGGDVGAASPALIHARRRCRGDQALRPLLAGDGQDVRPPGRTRRGQHAKMVNQVLIAGNMVGVCEGCSMPTRPA